MCDPVTMGAIFGTAASAGSASVAGAALGGGLAGIGAVGAGGFAATAATTGLIGVGGAAGFGGSLFSSAGFSLATNLVGFGVQMAGANMQADMMQQQLNFKQAQAGQLAQIKQQDIKAEADSEDLRQQLLAQQGSLAEGNLIVSQAALGQVVREGSAQDRTAQLAGDIAFKRLVSQRESDLFKRQLSIEASGAVADQGFLGAQRSAAKTANTIDQFGSVLGTASDVSSKFKFSGGKLAFA